uniref:Uncharacterized protein n=1 Tax=Triticum urartu TaxID=4572 RepID=A0A8R7QRJ1_TRIUA
GRSATSPLSLLLLLLDLLSPLFLFLAGQDLHGAAGPQSRWIWPPPHQIRRKWILPGQIRPDPTGPRRRRHRSTAPLDLQRHLPPAAPSLGRHAIMWMMLGVSLVCVHEENLLFLEAWQTVDPAATTNVATLGDRFIGFLKPMPFLK